MSLSVVIPARNAEATLAAALDSLRAQTRSDWNAIVVDDGSTDGTVQVALSYAARDDRIRLLSDGLAARGVAAARNRGIAAAEGRWLLFLDSDDWLLPAFVEKMLGALEATPGARLAYCGYRRVTPGGAFGPVQFNAAIEHQAFGIFARQCEMAIHACVLERALALEAGGFDTGLRTCEDWDFWVRVARTGVAFLPVPEPLVIYRIGEDSLTSKVDILLADARTVIERAFATGLAGAGPSCSQEMAIGYHALWCAARVVGRGGDGAPFVRPLPDRWGEVAEACRIILLDGLMVGAGEIPDVLPRDPTFLNRVRTLFEAVERATGRVAFARLLEFALEPELSTLERLSPQVAVGNLLLVRRDIDDLQPIDVPRGIDSVHLEFRHRGRTLSRIDLPAFGGLSRGELTAAALEVVSLTLFADANRLATKPGFWLHALLQTVQIGFETVLARRRHRPVPARSLRELIRAVTRRAILARAKGLRSANEQVFARLIEEARSSISTVSLPHAPRFPRPTISPDRQSHGRRRWESLYVATDPWNCASSYEQLKYRRTLELLPPGPIGKAMELGCAEGRFSEMLAPRVGTLIAADISATALSRARSRCEGHANVAFRRLDFFEESLAQDLDLLVCSEVLYYLPDVAELRRVGTRLAAALAPGGRLLTAHALVLADDPGRTGFDWNERFGGALIGETLGALPGLALERSVETDLYRIDSFRRLAEGETAPTPVVETVPLGPLPEPAYARGIVWNGAVARRAEVQARETADRVPILMYHRIAVDGPRDLARWRLPPAAFAEQMRWLRRHGYHAVTSDDLRRHRARGHSFAGRPVMISFDDGYRDFHEQAWPILRANDLTAEVFIVTDLVGDAARWDSGYGTPAPLMDWPQIQELAGAGVRFGSHLASHSHMADLTNAEIVAEAARSRATLERATGRDCLVIASPFGEGDDRFVRIARRCGYEAGFTTELGFAGLTGDAMRLPRIEVMGDWPLEAFARVLRPQPQGLSA